MTAFTSRTDAGLCVRALLLLLFVTVSRVSSGSEWSVVEESSAWIKLSVKGLDSLASRRMQRSEDKYLYEIGEWLGSGDVGATATILLVAPLSPGGRVRMVFVEDSRPPLRQLIRDDISDGTELGERGEAQNRYGKLDFQRFVRNNVTQCVYLRQFLGDVAEIEYVHGGKQALGDSFVEGWYCAAPETVLAEDELELFFVGIEIEGAPTKSLRRY